MAITYQSVGVDAAEAACSALRGNNGELFGVSSGDSLLYHIQNYTSMFTMRT